MREKYLDLLRLSEEGPGDSDILLLKECGIPYEGVEELALLHDVAEDFPISLEEIGAAYGEAGMFPRYASILRPRLPLLTKRPGEDYPLLHRKGRLGQDRLPREDAGPRG